MDIRMRTGVEKSRVRMKRTMTFAVFMTVLILVFPTLSGAVITIYELSTLQGRLAQGIAFVLAGILGLVIAKSRFGNMKYVGLDKPRVTKLSEYLWFAPLIIVEVIPLFIGIREGLSSTAIIIYLFFTAAVGFTEELYFRGIIWTALQEKSLKFAVLMSSFLFSVGHFLNLLAGASMKNTILQVIFAFLFALVAVGISYATGSIAIPILWHTIHNFVSLITVESSGRADISIEIFLGFVLLLYGVYLWLKFVSPNEKSKSSVVVVEARSSDFYKSG